MVENASGDSKVLKEAITANDWARWCTFLDLPENKGFAAGNNAALEFMNSSRKNYEYYLLLNPDTIARENALESLLRFMETSPKCGIAGSRLEDPDGTVQRSAFRFPSIASEFEEAARIGMLSKVLQRWIVAPESPQQDAKVDWVAGASMLIRREVIEQIGLLDDRFFMYYEEVDFCKRASTQGWECWYVPASRVVHLVGQSSGVTNKNAAQRRRPRYWFESRRRYFERHLGSAGAVLADLAWLAGYLLNAMKCLILSRPLNMPEYIARDLIDNSIIRRPGQLAKR